MSRELHAHETIKTNQGMGIDIIVVPGGWLYYTFNYNTDTFESGVFVPYNNEFEKPPSTF